MESIEKYYQIEEGPAFLLGNGPSLVVHDLNLLDPNQVITMNRSWKFVPKARYWLNAGNIDQARKTPQNIVFMGPDEDAVRKNLLQSLKCPVILLQTANAKLRPKRVKLDLPADLELRNGWPRNSNIGLLAIFWAWWVGFNPIFLLGYDGYGKHFEPCLLDRRPDIFATKHAKGVREYKQRTRALDGRVAIYNCNPENQYDTHEYYNYDAAIFLSQLRKLCTK